MLNEKTRKSIKKAMIDRDKKASDFAKEIGVSRQYISAILNGTMGNERIENILLEWKRRK
jgi:transcriptional regulator with XRE-family HTH domain